MTNQKGHPAYLTQDHPRIREISACPLCKMPKPKGLVICWDCNAQQKARFDGTWGHTAELILDRIEFMLKAVETAELVKQLQGGVTSAVTAERRSRRGANAPADDPRDALNDDIGADYAGGCP